MRVNSFIIAHAFNVGAWMTHNIQGNYMVPWKAFKSLPAEARAVLYLFVR